MGGNRIKAAVIEPVGGHGGMNYYDFGLCRGIISSDIDVILYTCDETVVPDGLPFPVITSFRHIFGKQSKLLKAGRYILGLFQSLRHAGTTGAKIVHFHFFHASLLEWFSVISARFYGFKIVVTSHDVESFSANTVKSIAEKIYHLADMVIVHNNVSKKELMEYTGLPESKIRIVPHGNYIGFFNEHISQQRARERLGLQGDGPFILFFGQIKKVKGLNILMEALPKVIARFPALRLIIAGKIWKDDFSLYQTAIEKNAMINNVVTHLRYIPDELVNYYFLAADIIVLPYKRVYQSGVLLMAMSLGLPVLVSDIEGMTEVIQDNINGFVFHHGNSDHLAERLINVLSDRKMMEAVAETGYETATARHDWTLIGAETAGIYRDLFSVV